MTLLDLASLGSFVSGVGASAISDCLMKERCKTSWHRFKAFSLRHGPRHSGG